MSAASVCLNFIAALTIYHFSKSSHFITEGSEVNESFICSYLKGEKNQPAGFSWSFVSL